MNLTIGVVLVVDDDPDIRAALRDLLGDNGYLVVESATGADVVDLCAQHQPDVVLLDLGLPDMSGLDLLTVLVEMAAAPVIVLSGRSGEADRVVGLELGADDYISKPFSARELVARVKAAVRRRHGVSPRGVITEGGLVINQNTRDVSVDGRAVSLTPREFDLLTFLALSPRQVYSRAQLLQQVWGSSEFWQDDNTVAEHIYRLRRKLDPDNRNRCIETVRGVGYRFTPSGCHGEPDAE